MTPMNRASLRAALLLAGFKPFNSPYKLCRVDPGEHPSNHIFVWAYPWWVIGVVTVYNIRHPKIFFSATKAWQHIQKLIGE